MPAVQFVRAVENVRITKSMRTPKRITDINAWLKEARKAIKELGELLANSDGWFVHTHDTDIKWVKFELRNKYDEHAQVVIDRTIKFGSV